jgi:hypothetical protein
MDRQMQDYYEDRFAMFATKGWRDLIEDVKDFEKGINTIDAASTPDMLYFRKGQLDMVRFILNLEAVSRDSYDKLKEGENASYE